MASVESSFPLTLQSLLSSQIISSEMDPGIHATSRKPSRLSHLSSNFLCSLRFFFYINVHFVHS
jgi:hypothetical protein